MNIRLGDVTLQQVYDTCKAHIAHCDGKGSDDCPLAGIDGYCMAPRARVPWGKTAGYILDERVGPV